MTCSGALRSQDWDVERESRVQQRYTHHTFSCNSISTSFLCGLSVDAAVVISHLFLLCPPGTVYQSGSHTAS
jgi:hypothetical protein